MKPAPRSAIKPVLFVTGHVPPDRIGPFARLHELENVELALFGGRAKHGPAELVRSWNADLPFPHRRVRQLDCGRLAASGRYRAVVCSTGGRLALPATWAGARRARAPLIVWASLWAHPRSAVHLFSYMALRRLYRSADAVVTYGPHVAAYVSARGARNVHVAPQPVDNAFWSAPVTTAPKDPAWPGEARVRFLFAGRPAREKGLQTLVEAWSRSGLRAPGAALVLVGVGSDPSRASAAGALERVRAMAGLPRTGAGHSAADGHSAASGHSGRTGVSCLDPVSPERLREMYAAADVLVVPSIATPTFREPWGLVVNEAMNRGLPVIASDAVGAVAGGLVRDGRNGLVVPAGDSAALARALRRLADDPRLRARMGAAGALDVQAYTHDAWAQGFSRALSTLGLSRAHW
ncbi:MAG TPA: glycosyltransferase family 4 protein [Solirubrobacteraceae bacterium]|nr:glycosyltransferase family 4 protein [Solirubrobacteraceae bacterium]